MHFRDLYGRPCWWTKRRVERKLARFSFKSKLFIKLVVMVNVPVAMWITWLTPGKSIVWRKDKPLGKLCMTRSRIGDKNQPLDNLLTFPQSMKKLFRTLSTGKGNSMESGAKRGNF
jgi:hypothetical protein